MKKKILSLCLIVSLVAVGVISGTLAYFTDTDEAANTFTTANVDIQLIEQQRNAEGSALENFENNKVLFPIVGSAQGPKDSFGLPVAENYVDKIITVKNLAADAYVCVYVAVPSALDHVGDPSQNILHFNSGNKFVAEGNKTDGDALNEDFANWSSEVLVAENFDIDGVPYNIYSHTYNKLMTKDMVTGSACTVGFYLDKGVDYDNKNGYYTINGEKIDFDFSNGVTVPVYAIGVQAEGFHDAQTAIAAAFGEGFNPWAK